MRLAQYDLIAAHDAKALPDAPVVASVAVREDRGVTVTVLFDPDQSLSERIIVEQFTV